MLPFPTFTFGIISDPSCTQALNTVSPETGACSLTLSNFGWVWMPMDLLAPRRSAHT
jgi:hypothetical protein